MSTVYGMSDEDKREIIADFLTESEQHVHTLNNLLLKAEELIKENKEISDDQVNMMFRSAHTIKGSASMLGFDNLSHLTHEMETALDQVRNKKTPLTLPMIEVLFEAFDSLNIILDRLRTEGNDSMDIKEIVKKIKSVLIPVNLPSGQVQHEPSKPAETPEMDKYLSAFLEDSEGCIQRFNEILLGWEKDEFSFDQLNELFRLVHTIKGSAGIIKCKGIESVAHRMEDLLVFYRSKNLKPPSDTMVLFFKGIDWIKNALDSLRKGNYQEVDMKEYLKQFKLPSPAESAKSSLLNLALGQDLLENMSDALKEKIKTALSHNNNIFTIVLNIKEGSLKAPKAGIIEYRLKRSGSVLVSVPGLENFPEHNGDAQVSILYATPKISDNIRSFLLLDEVQIISINKEDLSFLRSPVEAAVTADAPKENKLGLMDITTMKVDSRKLDHLMNLAGELVITRARFAQLISDLNNNTLSSKQVAAKVYDLDEATSLLGKLSSDIQSAVMQTRMVPIEGVFSRFKRVVRDIAKDLDKEVNLEIYGEETELDKKLVDALPDSLTHMIRNAVDHGIESRRERTSLGKKEAGTIQLRASHMGSSISIEIIDDGKGIDASKLAQKALEKGLISQEKLLKMDLKEKLNLIFLPGFSTAQKVTGLSGRGVGMDVVKKMIESLSGTIEIDTEVGQGSHFTLKIPLTLAIIHALLVVIKDQVFAIPLEDVSEIVKIDPKDTYSVDGVPMIKLRGHALSLVSMSKILGMPDLEASREGDGKVVIASAGGELYAIKVDRLIGEDEIVIKAFPEYFDNVKGISGASILGDGNIALILDVRTILQEI